MNQQVTLSIPTWVDPFGTSSQTWLLVVSVLAAALLASIVVEIIKRHHTKKEQEALAKHSVALLLTAFTSVFTLASYFITFAQAGSPILASVPFLARHMPQAVGVAYVIYAFRLNKTYQNVATYLGKWSKENRAANKVVAEPTPVEPVVASSDNLLS